MNPAPHGPPKPEGALHLVVNPIAGGGRAWAALPAIESALEASRTPFVRHVTDAPGSARAITVALPANDPVVVIGGDGTLHEVVGALLAGAERSSRPLGVIPFGTGNDFAREIGLKPLEIEGAVRAITRGRLEVLDSGRCGTDAFLNGVGSGFDAQVARSVRAAPRALSGAARYLWAIMAELSKLSVKTARVAVDGAQVYDGPSLLVAVMNLPCYGGGLRIAPDANAKDGMLDVIVGGRFNRSGALGILPKLARGKHLGHPEVRAFRGHAVRVEWSEPTDAHADGELLTPSRSLEVRALPGALRVFAPEQ